MRRSTPLVVIGLLVVLVLAACGGGAAATPTAEPTADPTPEATAEPSESAEPSEQAGGPAGLEAPSEVEAGAAFDVAWTGPNATGDYVTIVPAGATAWTFEDPYFNTNAGPTGSLVAPTAPGEYELWYVNGADDTVAFSVDVTVTPFEGDLLAVDEVAAGTEFEVAWNGPDGPGDYVTVVPVGADAWTGADPYFNTSIGPVGTLYAPMTDGDYEIWYVVGSDSSVQSRRPITVTPLEITIDAPESVGAGEDFEVAWTGPDGQGDYLTIVPEGSAEGAYLSYAYTYTGSTVTLTAPDEPGSYEIWYASDRVPGTFHTVPITVD